MATGAAIASAALTGLSAINQNQTMRRQDDAAAAAIRRNMQLQDQANQRVAQAIQQQSQSNPAAAQQSQMQQYLQQLQQAQQLAQQRLLRGGFGSAYDQRAAQDISNENDYANQMAGLMSAVDAPTLQRQQEAINLGNLGTGLGVIGSDASGNENTARLNAAGLRANPWLQAAAQGMQAYASGAK